MKNIELTEEHKSKLLEMCVELFREKSEINSIQNFRISNDYVLGLSDHTLYCENRDISDNYYNGEEVPEDELWNFYTYPIKYFDINIHWFEFCMTHLCDKISMNLTNQMCIGMPQYYDESEKLDWNSQSLVSMLKECHPVDYLYEEFLKLK